MTTIPEPLSIRTRQLPGRRYDRYFFAGMVVALLLTAFAGFAPTYYLAGLYRAKLPAPILHVHAVLQSAWMLLLLVQMLLVSAKRVPLHRKLGIAGFVLAAAMVPVAVMVAANELHRFASDGQAALSFSLVPLWEVCNFAVLAGSAFALRKHPAAHKRLIILATVAMMPAAVSRIPVHLIRQWTPWEVMAFVVVIAAYDIWSMHSIHAATLAGAGFIGVFLWGCMPLGHTAAWHVVARWMLSWNL
ncbi:MAG: hypothetical protein WB679_15600 [Terracidiphilus sp.]